MGLILFIVLIVAVATCYLHVKRKEKQEFLNRYQRYRVGDKGAFIGFNRFELKPDPNFDVNNRDFFHSNNDPSDISSSVYPLYNDD